MDALSWGEILAAVGRQFLPVWAALAVTFAVPVFAVIYGAVFLDEQVTPWMLFCGVVIVCGTSLSSGLLRLPALRRA